MNVSSGVDPGGVRFGPAQYTLFVEGDEAGSIDHVVLRELLEDRMPVRALGPSSRVRTVAKALQDHQPCWLFLIDRDFWSDDAVDRQRDQFEKGATNLLTWRRRAIENYIVDPKVFRHSKYLKSSPVLQEVVLKAFQERLFLNAANIVIEEVRERLKNTWIESFTDPGALPNREAARTALLSRPEWATFRGKVGEHTDGKNLRDQFDAVMENLTGGGDVIQYDHGTWLERMDAKPSLNRVVNECTALERSDIQGREKFRIVVRDLTLTLVATPDQLPNDFVEVRDLILRRVSRP